MKTLTTSIILSVMFLSAGAFAGSRTINVVLYSLLDGCDFFNVGCL